jgi:hypothetical protein
MPNGFARLSTFSLATSPVNSAATARLDLGQIRVAMRDPTQS